MTNEEIIKLARDAGITLEDEQTGEYSAFDDELVRFALLVAAAEREACARVCESRHMGDNNREDMEARRCADAIRAKSQR